MKHALVRMGLVSVAVVGLCVASQTASLARVTPATHPVIQAFNPSTPYVQGTGFTITSGAEAVGAGTLAHSRSRAPSPELTTPETA